MNTEHGSVTARAERAVESTAGLDELISRWRAALRSRPAAAVLDGDEIVGEMPAFVRTLYAEPRTPDTNAMAHELEVLDAHFSQRLRQGFALDDMLDEFALLRSMLLESAPVGPTHDVSVRRLDDAIRRANQWLRNAYDRYAEHDACTELQFARRLDAIVSPFVADARPEFPSATVDRMLACFCAAAQGRTAAALVVRGRVAMQAGAVGPEHQALARRAVELAESHATETQNARAGDAFVDVPRALLDAGIGTAFVAYSALVGDARAAVFLGIEKDRHVGPGQQRHLARLADRLLFQLEVLCELVVRSQTADAVAHDARTRAHSLDALVREVREPLATMRVNLDQLERELESDPARRDFAHTITRTAERLERTLHDVLDAQRLHRSKPDDLPLVPCDLAAITRDVVADLSRTTRQRIELVSTETLMGVWNADLLRRSIRHLVSNAVEHGSRTAAIRVELRTREGSVEVAVRNDGPPMPPHELARLAHAHRDGDAPTDAGVGLAVIAGCAASHCGSVEAVSDTVHGTTVTLRLPVDPRLCRPPEARIARGPSQPPPPSAKP